MFVCLFLLLLFSNIHVVLFCTNNKFTKYLGHIIIFKCIWCPKLVAFYNHLQDENIICALYFVFKHFIRMMSCSKPWVECATLEIQKRVGGAMGGWHWLRPFALLLYVLPQSSRPSTVTSLHVKRYTLTPCSVT